MKNNSDALIPNDLNDRQWELYKLLSKLYHSDPYKYINLKDIYDSDEVRLHYPFVPKGQEWNNSRARRMITSDLHALKASKRLHKVVISNERGAKIATETEAVRAIVKTKVELLKSVKLCNFQLEKLSLNGQGRLVFNGEKPFIEAFIKEYDDDKEVI